MSFHLENLWCQPRIGFFDSPFSLAAPWLGACDALQNNKQRFLFQNRKSHFRKVFFVEKELVQLHTRNSVQVPGILFCLYFI